MCLNVSTVKLRGSKEYKKIGNKSIQVLVNQIEPFLEMIIHTAHLLQTPFSELSAQ